MTVFMIAVERYSRYRISTYCPKPAEWADFVHDMTLEDWQIV